MNWKRFLINFSLFDTFITKEVFEINFFYFNKRSLFKFEIQKDEDWLLFELDLFFKRFIIEKNNDKYKFEIV